MAIKEWIKLAKLVHIKIFVFWSPLYDMAGQIQEDELAETHILNRPTKIKNISVLKYKQKRKVY